MKYKNEIYLRKTDIDTFCWKMILPDNEKRSLYENNNVNQISMLEISYRQAKNDY